MNIKLITLVIFVAFGERAPAVSSNPFHGLSEEELAFLSELGAIQEKAILARYGGHAPIFELLKKLAVEYIYDFEPKTSEAEIAAVIAEITRVNKIGVDYILDLIPIALRKSCGDIETTRSTLHTYLDYAYSLLIPVIELAKHGNYSAIQVTDEIVSFAPTFVAKIYDLIRECENTTDADTLAAIKTAEDKSATGIYHTNNGIFNGMKFLGIAVALGNKSQALISDIDEARDKTLSGLRDELSNECSVLEGLYINSLLNRSGIGSELILNQHTTIMRVYSVRKLVPNIFTDITNKMNRIIFRIFDDGEEVFSRTDLAEAKTAALITDASNHLFESIAFLRPEDSWAIAEERKVLHALADKIAANNFESIKVAVDEDKTHSQVIAEVEILKNEAVRLFGKAIEILIGLIRNDKTWSDETEANFAIIVNNAVLEANNYIQSIQDGAELLAKAAHENGTVSTDYISAVQAVQSRGISAAEKYVKHLSEASLISLLACNES